MVQNLDLWKKYQNEYLRMKKANSSDPVQKLLWHGTSCDPNIIMKKDGFSSQFANDQGLWGRAIYFAQLANYSHAYAQKSSEN